MNKKPNEIERRWKQAKHCPPWAREYIRAGLLREGFELIASSRPEPEFVVMPATLRLVLTSVGLDPPDDELISDIVEDLECGIMYLDEIARAKGLIPK